MGSKRSRKIEPENADSAVISEGLRGGIHARSAENSPVISTPQASPAPAPTIPPPPADESAVVLQDWTPLSQCLDWQVGRFGFHQRGSKAFTSHEVPNLINQGGLSAYRAADVLFAHCCELDAAGLLEPQIEVLEMAIGLGLHAVQMLDRFVALCQAEQRNYAQRLVFYATDATPQLLQDAAQRGIFARHRDRVVLGHVNALDPAQLTRLDTGETIDLTGRLRAVLHTYLLCVLPANLFKRLRAYQDDQPAGEHWQRIRDAAGQACWQQWGVVVARTLLRHVEELHRFTPLSLAQLQALAASQDAAQIQPLVPLYPLMDLGLSLAGFDPATLTEGPELSRLAERMTADLLAQAQAEAPQGDFVAPAAQEVWVLHSAGAYNSLEKTLELLRPNGFILYRDYGPATAARANGSHLYQHYGATTAFGVHHYGIDSWLQDVLPQPAIVSVPDGEGEASIKTRLVARQPLPKTRAAFQKGFDPQAFSTLEQSVEAARHAVDANACVQAYRHALQMEPDNWLLLSEAGEVVLRRVRNGELAAVLLQESLRINPWYNAGAWNALGDLAWTVGDFAQAESCYLKAVAANPEWHKGYLNLAECAERNKDFARAVELAGQALARDVDAVDGATIRQILDRTEKSLHTQRQLAGNWRRQRQAGASR